LGDATKASEEDFRQEEAVSKVTQSGEVEWIGFRRLEEGDLELLHRWYNTPHVLQWYTFRPYSYEEVAAKMVPRIRGESPTDPYLILVDEMPVGYIQTYRVAEHPDYNQYIQADEHSAGLDLFIGEADYLHRGLGALILRAFLEQVVFVQPWAEACIVGPEPGNQVAIRAYEKAGFRYWKTVQIPGEPQPECLLSVSRGASIK
jgi:RimJ/RimL family protein N-acetyltransferase